MHVHIRTRNICVCETMLNQSTLPHTKIHQEVVHDMKCHKLQDAPLCIQLTCKSIKCVNSGGNEKDNVILIYWISEMKILRYYLVLCLCFHALKDDEDQKLLSR